MHLHELQLQICKLARAPHMAVQRPQYNSLVEILLISPIKFNVTSVFPAIKAYSRGFKFVRVPESIICALG